MDAELCVGCGLCMESCQFGAMRVVNKRLVVRPKRCMGCGVCVSKCPKGALTLVRDEAKGTPLEIEKLMSESAGG